MSHTCRGTISLHGALIHTVDACTFVVSNGGTQTFHIKAATEVERQQWVTALELAKAKAIQAMESGLYQRNIIHFLSGVHQRERGAGTETESIVDLYRLCIYSSSSKYFNIYQRKLYTTHFGIPLLL